MYTYTVQTCNIYAVLFSCKTNEYITCEYISFIFVIENSGPLRWFVDIFLSRDMGTV